MNATVNKKGKNNSNLLVPEDLGGALETDFTCCVEGIGTICLLAVDTPALLLSIVFHQHARSF